MPTHWRALLRHLLIMDWTMITCPRKTKIITYFFDDAPKVL